MTIQTNGATWLFIEVPVGAWAFDIIDGVLEYNNHKQLAGGDIDLPEDSQDRIWEIYATSDEITESECCEIVEQYKRDGYFCYYENGGIAEGFFCEEAIRSFQSLLRANNLMGRYTILKEIK